MKKVLVLGAAGMAGHIVYTFLKESKKYEIIGTTNSSDLNESNIKLDIFNIKLLENILDDIRPDYIINCIGMLIKGSKEYPDKTIYTNAYFPHALSKLSGKIGAKLIHISTDCVFSGKIGSYTEKSFKDAVDIYGLSKSLGEIIDERNLTIRTSIIGPEIKNNGEGLFHWFMRQEGTVNGYRSNIWSGVTTLELARFIDWVIENPIEGLVHLTNNEPISKYNLLQIFNEVYQRNVIIIDEKDYVCDKSFISTNNKITYVVPTYQKMIQDQKEFMLGHKNFYENYF